MMTNLSILDIIRPRGGFKTLKVEENKVPSFLDLRSIDRDKTILSILKTTLYWVILLFEEMLEHQSKKMLLA